MTIILVDFYSYISRLGNIIHKVNIIRYIDNWSDSNRYCLSGKYDCIEEYVKLYISLDVS